MRTLLALVAATCSLGCATTVTQRYCVAPGHSAAETVAQAQEAAARLGWVVEKASDERFFILELPLHHLGPVEVEGGADGTLTFRGQATPRMPLFEVAPPMLALATRQVMGVDVAQRATPYARSLPLTIVLDLLVPVIGGTYALSDNPYAGAIGWPWAPWLARLGLDAVGCGLLAEAILLRSTLQRDSTWVLIAAVESLVLNRVLALITDIPVVRAAGLASAAGLSFDLDRAPRPLEPPLSAAR